MNNDESYEYEWITDQLDQPYEVPSTDQYDSYQEDNSSQEEYQDPGYDYYDPTPAPQAPTQPECPTYSRYSYDVQGCISDSCSNDEI
jgi:hypothetical protein